MDTQAVNNAGNLPAPKPKPAASSSGAGASSAPAPQPIEDTVSLSNQGQELAQAREVSAPSSGAASSSNNEQRKFSVTEDNDVVLKVIDPETQKIIKSVPSEEQLQLSNAIRDGIKDLTE